MTNDLILQVIRESSRYGRELEFGRILLDICIQLKIVVPFSEGNNDVPYQLDFNQALELIEAVKSGEPNDRLNLFKKLNEVELKPGFYPVPVPEAPIVEEILATVDQSFPIDDDEDDTEDLGTLMSAGVPVPTSGSSIPEELQTYVESKGETTTEEYNPNSLPKTDNADADAKRQELVDLEELTTTIPGIESDPKPSMIIKNKINTEGDTNPVIEGLEN